MADSFTPIHPGFAGTPRPDGLTTVPQLATLYASLLVALELDDVTVVGNSIGGWVAAEMALLDVPRTGSFVLVDAVGVEVAGHAVVDFFSLTPRQIAERSYHDPDRYGIDPANLPAEALQAMAANRATLTRYTASGMTDPTLLRRLRGVTKPTGVVWGQADRIVDVDYGRALAAAIPGASFQLVAEAGHLPQIEAPDRSSTPSGASP